MIGQPGVASRVQDEEVRGVGHNLTRLVHKRDGGRRIGPDQSEEDQRQAGVRGLAVVSLDPEDLGLNCGAQREKENSAALIIE